MKSMLGKALLTTVGALAIAGISAPAYAEVDAGGGSGFVATAEDPFVAWGHHFWAATDDVFFADHGGGWATSTSTGGGDEFISNVG